MKGQSEVVFDPAPLLFLAAAAFIWGIFAARLWESHKADQERKLRYLREDVEKWKELVLDPDKLAKVKAEMAARGPLDVPFKPVGR